LKFGFQPWRGRGGGGGDAPADKRGFIAAAAGGGTNALYSGRGSAARGGTNAALKRPRLEGEQTRLYSGRGWRGNKRGFI
jgi:hypothetical protein